MYMHFTCNNSEHRDSNSNVNYLRLQVQTIVFDKTGTLTVGKPVVVSSVLFSSFSMEEVCEMATATEVGFSPIS